MNAQLAVQAQWTWFHLETKAPRHPLDLSLLPVGTVLVGWLALAAAMVLSWTSGGQV